MKLSTEAADPGRPEWRKDPLRGRLSKMLERYDPKVKFIVVGIWNTAVGYLVFVCLYAVFSAFVSRQYLAYMPAMIIGQILAILNAFVFHKYVSFMSAAKGFALAKEFLRFTMTYLFTFCVNLVLLPVLVEVLHLSPRAAAAVIILAVTVVSYTAHSRFTFGKGKRAP